MADWFLEHALILGLFVTLLGSMMTVYAAFRKSFGWGIACLLLPVIQVIFLLFHLRRRWPAALVLFTGIGLVIAGIGRLGGEGPGGLGWMKKFEMAALQLGETGDGQAGAEDPFDATKLLEGVDAGDPESVLTKLGEYVGRENRPPDESEQLAEERRRVYEERKATRGRAAGLMEAVTAGDRREVRRLLEAGVRPDWKNALGETPLMTAAALGYAEIAHMLLDHGADTTLTSAAGQTALDIARQNYRTDIVRLLEEVGEGAAA